MPAEALNEAQLPEHIGERSAGFHPGLLAGRTAMHWRQTVMDRPGSDGVHPD